MRLGKIFNLFLVFALLIVSASCVRARAVFYTDADSVELPIIMYHSILKDPARAGDYTVSPEVLKADLLYLKQQGYQCVVVSDLISYVNGEPLPKKPVMITFDDGHYNNLTYALPILEELDMKAVISVVGSYTQKYSENPDPNPNYAYLSYEDIKTLVDSGRFEIQNHSFDMHTQGKKYDYSETSFCADVEKCQQLLTDNCNVTPTAYTYPFGKIIKSSRQYLIDLGFYASLTCHEKVNTVTRDPMSLFGLGRFNRPSGISTEEFMARALNLD